MSDKNMEAQISVEFEEATSRQSLNSGETINTLWSKVKRWLSDLKAVAFSGSYNDLSDKPKIPNVDSELSETSENPVQNKIITSALNNKAESNHVHSYAGSSSEGGSATSAVKLDSSAGSTVNPVYFSEGKPVACTYTLGKSVPSNAVFTDTVYTLPKATISALGGVMPDGTTINVDENGVISAVGSGKTNYTIQYGVATPSDDGRLTVKFPNPFKTTPIVVVSPSGDNDGLTPVAYLAKDSVSTISFSAYERAYNKLSSNFLSANKNLYWIAIGEV